MFSKIKALNDGGYGLRRKFILKNDILKNKYPRKHVFLKSLDGTTIVGFYLVTIWSLFGHYFVAIWSLFGRYLVAIWSLLVAIWSLLFATRLFGHYLVAI